MKTLDKFRTYIKSFIFIMSFISISYNGFGQACSSYTDWYQATWNSGQVVELVGTDKLYEPTYSSTNAPLTDSWNRCEVSSPCTNFWKLAGTCTTILPIELSLFNAVIKGDLVDINWQTTSEKNNDYFVLEKSYDTKKWFNITNVKGKGTVNSIQNYNWKYIVDFNGTCYYRLSQVDVDGKTETFNIVSVNSNTKKINEIIVYPNPSSDHFSLEYFSDIEDEFNILIESDHGQEVYHQNHVISKGENNIHLSSVSFSSGLYIVVIENNLCEKITKKLIKN